MILQVLFRLPGKNATAINRKGIMIYRTYKWQLLFELLNPIDSIFVIDTLFKEQSPDKKWNDIVYRYMKNNSKDNFLDISVLKQRETLSEYENLFISGLDDDYILIVSAAKIIE